MADSDRPQLPPGQQLTAKFPVVGERAPPPTALDLSTWRLTMDGLVATPLSLSYSDILALPQSDRSCAIHCVTGWSRLGSRFTGTPLAHLLNRAGVLPSAAFVRFAAYSDRSHDTSLPLQLAIDDTWLVHSIDGDPLTPAHGYPLRTLTPSRYFYKSLKWLRHIELLEHDTFGYWEGAGGYYHNNGDPWVGGERYDFDRYRVDAEEDSNAGQRDIKALRERRNLSAFRKRVLLGIELTGWKPAADDLSGLQIKASNLAGAELAGKSLRGINLTHCNLRNVDFRGCDLRDADLEGADLSGADLRDADLRGALLSSTRFFVDLAGAERLAARVEGLRWTADGAGLLEEMEAFLRSAQR